MNKLILSFVVSVLCVFTTGNLSAQSADYTVPTTYTASEGKVFKLSFEQNTVLNSYVFVIYDQSKKVVFRTRDQNAEWTGMNLRTNSDAEAGEYVWKMDYTVNGTRVQDEGTITLKR